jgi:hypothetical protein
VRDIDPFSSKASMIAVRDVETPGAEGRRKTSSIARSDEWFLLSGGKADFSFRGLGLFSGFKIGVMSEVLPRPFSKVRHV